MAEHERVVFSEQDVPDGLQGSGVMPIQLCRQNAGVVEVFIAGVIAILRRCIAGQDIREFCIVEIQEARRRTEVVCWQLQKGRSCSNGDCGGTTRRSSGTGSSDPVHSRNHPAMPSARRYLPDSGTVSGTVRPVCGICHHIKAAPKGCTCLREFM